MIELVYNKSQFKEIKKNGYLFIKPNYYVDKDENQYPNNIYKLISNNDSTSFIPVLDENKKFNELENLNISFKIQTTKGNIFYMANILNVKSIFEIGQVQIFLTDFSELTKKEYNKIKKLESIRNNVDNQKLLFIQMDSKQLERINEKLYMDLIKYDDSIIRKLQSQFFMIQSTLSNKIYHYKVRHHEILKNNCLRIYFSKPCHLVGEDAKKLNSKSTNLKSNITRHVGKNALLVYGDDFEDSLTLKLKKSYIIQALNEDIKKGLVKFIFNHNGKMKRIANIKCSVHSKYYMYFLRFYRDNEGIKNIKEYIIQNKVLSEYNFHEFDNERKVTYYRIDNRKSHNSNFNRFDNKDEKNKVNKTFNVIDELQIIDSSNNHATKHHSIENSIFYIRTKGSVRDNGSILVDIHGHYCKDCNKYFDFKNSFLLQLTEKKILVKNVITKLIDEKGQRIMANQLRYDLYNKESILHTYGYRVGDSGIPFNKRREIMDKIINENILHISEIKQILNRNISAFKRNKRYEAAVSDWKNDLDYLNSQY